MNGSCSNDEIDFGEVFKMMVKENTKVDYGMLNIKLVMNSQIISELVVVIGA